MIDDSLFVYMNEMLHSTFMAIWTELLIEGKVM